MRYFKLVLVTLIAVCIFSPLNAVAASPAKDQLKTSIDGILEILKDPALKGDESKEKRRASLRDLISERFSFVKMSQYSLGKHWKKRTDEEKKAFVKLFGQLLEDTYVSKIESYTNEKIEFVKEDVKKKKAQINTVIITETVEIPIDYRMFLSKNGSWKVYDMVIEGVSLVGNFRTQFDQILQKDSFGKLMEEIQKKLD